MASGDRKLTPKLRAPMPARTPIHSVFIAVVEAHEEQADSGVTNVRFAKLNLIDLAGKWRGSSVWVGGVGEGLGR